MDTKERYITTAELAKMLGISRVAAAQKVTKFIKEDKISASEKGKGYIIDKESLPAEIKDEIRKQQEEAAKKLKGAAAVKAEAEAQQLRNEQATASVVKPPEPAAKIDGVAAKDVWTFDIPEVAKIPERYLIKHEGALVVTGGKKIVVCEVDAGLMAKDAEKIKKAATWCTASSKKATRAT